MFDILSYARTVMFKDLHALQVTILGNPDAQRLQLHYLFAVPFNFWIYHVIMFDIFCNNFTFVSSRVVRRFSQATVTKMGDAGCTAIAGALPQLLALQYLNLSRNYVHGLLHVCTTLCDDLSHAADDEIGAPGCAAIAEALPHLFALQNLDLSCNYVRWFTSCLYRDAQGSFTRCS